MNPVLEKKLIAELDCSPNFAYVVKDRSVTLTPAYKYLQSQTDVFVRCMNMRYNGDLQLFYITKSLKSFSAMVRSHIDPESFMMIVANLLSSVVNVRNIGFIPSRNIDLSFDRIFVDPMTYKVKLVYLPLSINLYEDEIHMDNELRSGLLRMITANPELRSPRTMEFASDLRHAPYTLDDLYAKVKGAKIQVKQEWKSSGSKESTGEKSKGRGNSTMRLVAMDAPNRVEINVEKDQFVLGRNSAADGIISFNNKVGRFHCRIEKQAGRYSVVDLNSKNGTCVNGSRLEPNRAYPLNNGDKLRLADCDFKVIILWGGK